MAYIGPFRDGWRAQVQKDGARVSKTFKYKRDAQAWALEQESKKSLRRDRSLGQACEKYLETASAEKRNAVEWERRRFAALRAYFGDDIQLADITSERMGEWRDSRLNGVEDPDPEKVRKPVSGSTVLREVNLYRNMFRLAVSEWKWLEHSPFEGVRLPKEAEPRQAVWTWLLILRILRAGKRTGGKTLEVTQAFHIALRTAMRLQEALAAPANFDAKRRVVTIPPSKTNPRPEDIPVTRQAHRVLAKMPKKLKVEPNEASTLFSKLCKKTLIEGLEFRDSRATALTLMSRKMDILTLARISRHRDLDLLRRVYYRESAEKISARL
ncbi:hypothetical protein [Pseudorhodoferax sp. Leaf274]|uniref:tyrosine-type recombinase/integrase n=1 Tax=Pseudorhodoferax sp. Leaf274 TaxID=1736318 RepID=UPI000702761D|nr:hypothetical protein [Pseudorhodoferax sp. Leaf274]KQP36151.1 hypothetical protein ASF44_16415 [Pseudorhodoferax sp. Leaf274]